MTERTAPQLELPYASTHCEPHVDSEEAIQYERHRVPRELEPIHSHEYGSQKPEAPRNSKSHTSLRSCSASATASHNHLRRQESATSSASTQPDVHGSSVDRRTTTSSTREPHWHDPITKFWNTHISITIDDGDPRDHLALERTFLGYLRTSFTFVMTGVLTAQIFRLQRVANPDPHFGFYVIGRPLSILFMSMGIVVVLVGALRCWKLQNALVRGKAQAGGWEVLLVIGLSILLLIVTFALVLGVNIEKAIKQD